jgi:aspartyl-tRNA synthetase
MAGIMQGSRKGYRLTRTHSCGQLRLSDAGAAVVLTGWVHRRRDLGGVIFVDLRDRSGIVQIVFHPDFSREALELADTLRAEYVIAVRGRVVRRDPETVNPNLATGEIEVRVEEMEILNKAKTPPFSVAENTEVEESVRLKYRYLDLRRPAMQETLRMRHQVTKCIRDFLDANGFLEIETPILTKSTPEGARDYLVPSRVHPGEFYALPQSPQLFKQLLMVAGMERYYQIARCFRDEDLRADRQPEFTQVDIETSFMPASELQAMMETMMAKVFRDVLGVTIPTPFPRLTYREAMDRFGTDKPDLRFGLELRDVTDCVAQSGFNVFRAAIQGGGQVKGINAKGCASFSRKEIDELIPFVARYGAKGLAWIAVTPEGERSPIAKFLSPEEMAGIKTALEAEEGDLLLLVAGPSPVVADALGNLRLKLGKERGLIDESQFCFLWVTEFPLLGYDEEEKRWVAEHHPFTMPMWEDLDLLPTDPGKVRAQAYDLVLNGYEIGGGSMRIFQRDVQEDMFRALGFSLEEAKEKFGFLLEAFEYGTPPHGGIAFGLDRIVMIMARRPSLRDCIAFPKTASATDLMMGAPSEVSPRQWKELHLELRKQK